jgi:DNA-binding transcriptional regulator YdaS (Cro superfamily)
MDKLYDYLHDTMRDETAYQRYERFAQQLGVTMFCVRKWVYGQRRVPDDMKILIEKITNGKVTVDDLVRG